MLKWVMQLVLPVILQIVEKELAKIPNLNMDEVDKALQAVVAIVEGL